MTTEPILIPNLDDWNRVPVFEVRATKTVLRIYPSLVFSVTGLDPVKKYHATVLLERSDDFKHKFTDNQWLPWCNSDIERPACQRIFHKDGARTGAELMESFIDFSYVNITTGTKGDPSRTFTVDYMHRYQPSFGIVEQGMTYLVVDPSMQFIAVSKFMTDECKQLRSQLSQSSKPSRKRSAMETIDQPIAKRNAADQPTAYRHPEVQQYQPEVVVYHHQDCQYEQQPPVYYEEPLPDYSSTAEGNAADQHQELQQYQPEVLIYHQQDTQYEQQPPVYYEEPLPDYSSTAEGNAADQHQELQQYQPEVLIYHQQDTLCEQQPSVYYEEPLLDYCSSSTNTSPEYEEAPPTVQHYSTDNYYYNAQYQY